MQRRVIEQIYLDSVKTGNKLILKTNIPQSAGINGIEFQSFILNPLDGDKVKRWVTSIDFNVLGIRIKEKGRDANFNLVTYNTYIDYESVVSVVEVVNK